jgi:hypothetical protein
VALAEATVRVTLEVSKFERDLRQKVTQAANKAGRDFDREMKSSMASTGREATNEFRTAARTNMSRAGRDAASAFDNEFRTGLGQTAGKAGQRLSQGLRTSVSRAGLDAGRGFADNITNVLEASGQHAGERLVDSISDGILRSGNRAGRAVGRSIDTAATTEVTKAGKEAGKKFSLSFGVGTVGGSRPIILAFAALGSYATEALRPATGILAAFPGLLGAIVTSAAVGVVAFKGIGDAIKAVGSGDIDKLNSAMSKLSPQAQAFVREFAAVRPQLQAIKADIQDAFFGQFNGQIRDIAAALSGDLRGSLTGVGTSLGSLARQFTSTFTQAQGVTNLNKLFQGTSGFLDRLAPGLANLSRGFLNFVGGTAPGLKDIGQALGDMLTKFGLFLTESGNSGKALTWLEGGIAGMRNLASEVGDLVHAFTILFNAAQPLSFLLGGLTSTLIHLVGIFGDLPAPIQTAALAAALLASTGLPKWLQNTVGESSPVAKAITDMGGAFNSASARARTFINDGAGLPRLAQATGRAFDAATTATGRLASTLTSGLTTAADLAANGVSRASQAVQTGLNRTMLEAADATTRASSGIRDSFVNASIALAEGATTAGAAVSRFGTSMVTNLGQAGRGASNAMADAGNSLRVGFARGVQAAENATARLSTALQTGVIRASIAANSALDTAGAAARRFGTAIETGVIRSAIAGNNALTTVGTALRGSVLRPLVEAQGAYTTASTSVRNFASAQTALNGPLGQSPGLLGRVRDGFTELRAVATGSATALGSLASGPLSAAKKGIENIGSVAAGVGGSLSKGLGSAISGLTGALGGPWGLALTGATVALGFLSSAQDDARQAAAEHAAEISTLADTLNKETGAVTAATKQSLLNKIATSDTGDQARKLGISMNLVADAATGSTGAQAQLYEALRKSAEASGFTSEQMKTLQDTSAKTGVSVQDLELALLGNQDALGKVKGAFGAAGIDLNHWTAGMVTGLGAQNQLSHSVSTLAGDLAVQQQHIRDAANAMTPAQVTAQKYADAIGVLADKTSDADAKSRALAIALDILAGGTVSAEVAQGRFTELLKSLDDQLGDASKGLAGYGVALVTNEGRINTQTTAGAFLVGQYDQIRGALTDSVGATIAAGKANGDLEGAYVKVAQQTADARAQFIQTAQQLGLNKEQANQLADAYGLIPALVLTTVTDQGSALNTQLQVAAVGQKLDDLPVNTPVRVEGLTQDAINKLNEVGIKTRTLPDGSVEVTAATMQARQQLDQLIRSYQGRVINFATSIMGGKAMGDIVENKIGNVLRFANGGKNMRTMPANRAQIVGPNTWRVIGDRARDDEAYIPINRSGRSRALLAETARRMGFSMFAEGGMASGQRSTATTPVTQVSAGAIVVNAPYADPELVAKATLNELARAAVG